MHAGKSRCSVCEKPGHNRQNCPERHRSKSKRCEVCEDLPHRREESPCPGCDKLYYPEPSMTIFEVMQMPREDRRVMPGLGD